MPRSRSYAPRDPTTERAKLESANAYVTRDDDRSACRDGRESLGEVLKRLADRVVRQLNTWEEESILRGIGTTYNYIPGSDERLISPCATHPIMPYNWGRYSSRIYNQARNKGEINILTVGPEKKNTEDAPSRASESPSHHDRRVCSPSTPRVD